MSLELDFPWLFWQRLKVSEYPANLEPIGVHAMIDWTRDMSHTLHKPKWEAISVTTSACSSSNSSMLVADVSCRWQFKLLHNHKTTAVSKKVAASMDIGRTNGWEDSTQKQRDQQIDGWIDRKMNEQTDRQTDTYRQTDTHAYIHTGRQAGRQINR